MIFRGRLCIWMCVLGGLCWYIVNDLEDQHNMESQYRTFLDFYGVLYMPEIDWANFKDWNSRTYPSNLTNRFDWQLWPSEVLKFPGHRRSKDPQTVHALPKAVGHLLRTAAMDFDANRSDRVVVFGGDETPLSQAFGSNDAGRTETVRSLRKWFRAVYYYVKDVEVEGVMSMPVGLAHYHLGGEDQTSAAAKAIASVRLDNNFKEKSVLASFSVGTHSDHLEWATRYSDEEWAEAFAKVRCEPPSKAIALEAFNQRMEIAEWGQTDAAMAVGVDFRRIVTGGAARWWEELAKYRFLLCPLGSGIQSIKIFEALMVLTVPIIKRSTYPVFDDMVRLGFPLVIVDDWAELTPPRLQKWWQELKPRLASFRHNCLTANGFWHIFTSGHQSCH